MAAVTLDKLSKAEKDELCVSYAALMLHDDDLEINVSLHNASLKRPQRELMTLTYFFW